MEDRPASRASAAILLDTGCELFSRHGHSDIGPICAVSQAASLTTAGDLLLLPLLTSGSYPAGWEIWAQASGLDAARLQPRRSFSQFIYMIQAAIAGLGVGIAPSVLVREEIDQGRLAAPLGFVGSGDRISLCVLKRRTQEPAIVSLLAWLLARFPGAGQQRPSSTASRIDASASTP